MARNVEDLSFFLDSMVGYCSSDPLSTERNDVLFFQKLQAHKTQKLKIGYTKDFNLFSCNKEVKEMIDNTMKLIENIETVTGVKQVYSPPITISK